MITAGMIPTSSEMNDIRECAFLMEKITEALQRIGKRTRHPRIMRLAEITASAHRSIDDYVGKSVPTSDVNQSAERSTKGRD